ncbi:MAG: DUF4190 domain-containing protein [Eubacterium sp.]|nr:DUF4190 domain-containing protein [Eubacterium sp.]
MEENRFEQNIEQDPQTQQTPVMAPAPKQKKKHMGLAIASLILSGLSILCCWIYGFAIIPGIIGTIFGLICIIGAEDKNVRIMGIFGLIMGIIGVVISGFVIVTLTMVINWSAITPDALNTITKIDPNDQTQVMEWLQQFFKVDLSPYY